MEFTLKNKAINVCAKRGSGKSCLIKYLLNCELDIFDKVYVICPTERVNHFYSDIVPENCIFEIYSESWVSALIEKLTQAKEQGKNRHVLLILDDLVSDVAFHHSKTLKQLYTRGRHLNLSVIMSMQFLHSIPPVARANADYVVCSQLNSASVDILCNEYLSGDISKRDFCEMYHKNSTDYRFFVINCNTVKNNSDLSLIYGNMKVPKEYID